MTPVWQSPAMGRTSSHGPGECGALLRPDGACPLVNPGANERHQEVLPGREQGQPADEAGTTWMVALGGGDAVGDPSHGVKDAPMWAARLDVLGFGSPRSSRGGRPMAGQPARDTASAATTSRVVPPMNGGAERG